MFTRDAVDPADPNYGAPFTLEQAQQHISKSPVGNRITWHQALPEEFLASTETTWDIAVLSHCIWYFESPESLRNILTALKGRVTHVCIAEYALHATQKAAIPHVLASIARGTLESYRNESNANIRSPMSPQAITQVATQVGWSLQRQCTGIPELELLDGHWEVSSVTHDHFVREIEESVQNDRLKLIIESTRQATVAAVGTLNGGKVGTMDVWVAIFSLAV
jgi:hypothetical protein